MTKKAPAPTDTDTEAAPLVPEPLAPETFDPTEAETPHPGRINVVNADTSTEEQRSELQAALTRLNSISWAARQDVYTIRALLFGDGNAVT